MAESYRGLTIRIGGDTTKLTQALKAANQAAAGTQQELRKIGQALKLDPSNIEAYSLQMGYMANQAANAAMRLKQLKEAQEYLEGHKVKVGVEMDDEGNLVDIKEEIKDIIAAEKDLDGVEVLNVSQKVGSARAVFNQLTKSLATMHTELTELSADAANIETKKLKEALDVSQGKKSVEAAREAIEKLFEGMDEGKLNDVMEKASKQLEASVEAFDFDKLMNMDSADSIAEALSKGFADVPSRLRPSKEAIEKMAEDVVKMRDEYAKAAKEVDRVINLRARALESRGGKENATTEKYKDQIDSLISAADEKMAELGERFSERLGELATLSGEVFKFDADNTDIATMQQALEEISETLNLDAEQTARFVGEANRLVEAFRQADTDLKKWNVIAEFEDLVVEIEKGRGSLVNFAKVMSDMKAPSELMRGMSELTANVTVLDEAYKRLMSSGAAIEESIKADPSDMQAVKAAMDSYAAAALVATENVTRLNAEIKQFEDEGVSMPTDPLRSTAQSLFDAQTAAEKARESLANVTGVLAHYETRLAELEGTQGESIKNEEEVKKKREENAEQIDRLNEKIAEYKAKREEAQAVEKKAANDLELAKKQSEYEGLIAKVEAFKAKVNDAYEAEARLSAMSEVQSGLGSLPDEIKDLDAALDAATKRYEKLKEASDLKPHDVELRTQKEQAFADAVDIAAKRSEKLKQAIESMDASSIDRAREKYGSVENAIVSTTKATADAKQKYNEAKDKLVELAAKNKSAFSADEIIEQGSALDSKLEPELVEARNEVYRLGDAWKECRAEMVDATTADTILDFRGKLADATNGLNKNGESLVDEAAFQQAMSRMAQYAERAGQQIVESANTIDSAYRDMRKTVDGTEEQYKALSKAATEFSQTHAVSADTILEMESLGGQLGVAIDRLQEFGEVASHLEIATDIGAEDIALQMGQLSNIMADFNDTNFTNFADALVRLGNNTATTESAIMGVAQRMAAVANVTSMTTPELLAWSAAIASTGQRSESAATSITRTITGIGQAVAEGGTTLEQFAKIAGMSAEEFKSKWETSSSEALEAFVKGLGKLTDNSTDAISALDSVGISSVRQETALLALSQTINNLDASLEHATKGWENGGDAAREAEEKSKGFSGSLAILKNNLADLSASMGDGLVIPMRVLSSALETLTDLLNLIPGPVKSLLVTFGGLSAVIGTAYPMFSQITQKLTDLGITAQTLPAIFKIVTHESSNMEQALISVGMSAADAAKMATAAAALGATLKATGIGLAITAGLALIGEMINLYKEWEEHQELLKGATTDLTDALGAATDAYEAYDEGIKKTTRTYEESRDATESTLKSVAAFGDKINETMTSFGESSAEVDHFAEIIKRLGNNGSITKDELAVLTNAVEQYNSITGSSIAITDEATGALNLNSEAIDSVTEAYKRQAEQQAYVDLLNEAIKEQAKLEMELKQKADDLNAANEKLDGSFESMFDYMSMMQVKDLTNDIAELEASSDSVSDTIDYLTDKIDGASSTFPSLEAALTAAGTSLEDFGELADEEKEKLRAIEKALNDAGTSLYNFGSLNKSQLSEVASAWNGSAGDIISSIRRIKEEAASVASETSESLKNAADDAVTAFKRAQEDAYTNRKRQLDDEYTALKNSLDRSYNDTKKNFDREYDAAKSASDKWLKAFKKAQEDEVEAFKKATDQKLSEMEREYEYKKKLLDDEYSGYDSDIQSRIDAIKAEQDAEDKASRQKERDEKVAELKLEVQRAKSRRKRQEAEKKLNDYLAEIQAEDVKESREAEIEKLENQRDALKDQLSERQETLKQSYDMAVSEYKAEREAILKIMQDAHEAEYDAQKEAQEAQLKSLKDYHESVLADIKASNEAALQQRKRQNEDELTELKRQQEDALNEFKRNQDKVAEVAEETVQKVKASVEEVEKTVKEKSDDIAKDLYDKGKVSADAYISSLSPVPGSVRSIFEDLGITLGNGAELIAQKMFENGDITLQQYLAILRQVPGSTQAIMNETGLVVANELGILPNEAYNAALGIKGAVDTATADMPEAMGQRASEAGQNLASLGGQATFDAMAANSDSLAQQFNSSISVLPQMGKSAALGMGAELNNGIVDGGSDAIDSAGKIADGITKTMDISSSTGNLGQNAAVGWNNSWVEYANRALNNVRTWAQSVLSIIRSAHKINSPSREFAWMAEMDIAGFEQGWKGATPGVIDMVGRTSGAMLDAMDNADIDVTQSILDSMRRHEDDLRSQAERMAEIVEKGFDPHMAVDAAFEAIDRIDTGKMRAQATVISEAQNPNGITGGITININIPEMVVREEADIDRLSRRLAVDVQRQLNSRIG